MTRNPATRKSAKGSHVVWGGWEPRICVICGRRVTLDHTAFHGGATTVPWSIHAWCGGIAEAYRRAERG
jgi:hypothetical protein